MPLVYPESFISATVTVLASFVSIALHLDHITGHMRARNLLIYPMFCTMQTKSYGSQILSIDGYIFIGRRGKCPLDSACSNPSNSGGWVRK